MLELNPHDVNGKSLNNTSHFERNLGIDIIKIICSFMVVYCHTSFDGVIGNSIYMLSRIAVPNFFIITGFFYHDTIQRGRKLIQIKKIFNLFFTSNFIFFLLDIVKVLYNGTDVSNYFIRTFNENRLKNFFIFNHSLFEYHLWYMGAILYTLVIMCFIYQPQTKKWLQMLIPVLLIVDLIFGDYSVVIFEKTFNVIYVRNFMFVGIPYFLIGTLLRDYRHIIAKKSSYYFWLICTSLFSILTILERFILVTYGVEGNRKHNIFTTFLAISFFLLFLRYFENYKPNRLTDCLTMISTRYSVWIYIIHPIFITIFEKIISAFKLAEYYKYVQCIVVYLGVLIFLFVADKMCSNLKLKISRAGS